MFTNFPNFFVEYLMVGQIHSVDGTVLDNSAPTIDIRTFVVNNRALEARNDALIELLDDAVNFSLPQSVDQKVEVVHQKQAFQSWIFVISRS